MPPAARVAGARTDGTRRRRTSRHGRGRDALLGVLFLTLALLGGLVPSASAALVLPAHADVLSVSPADGSSVERLPASVVITVSDEVNPAFVQVTLSGGGIAVPLGPPSASGGTVTVPVLPGSAEAPGAYRLAFRVVSADGHPVSGSSSFTVTGPAAGSSGTASPTSSPPAATAGSSATSAPATAPVPAASTASGGPALGVLAVVGAFVLAAAGVLLRARRARSR